jgi:hypothetical protein
MAEKIFLRMGERRRYRMVFERRMEMRRER